MAREGKSKGSRRGRREKKEETGKKKILMVEDDANGWRIQCKERKKRTNRGLIHCYCLSKLLVHPDHVCKSKVKLGLSRTNSRDEIVFVRGS